MANSNIQTIMEKIETKINNERVAAGLLPFMVNTRNVVQIIDELPADGRKQTYYKYRISIYPDPDSSITEQNRIGNRVRRDYVIKITCERRAVKTGRFRLFSDSNDTEYGVGVYEMVNRVMDILRHNTLDNTINPRPIEFSNPQFEGDTEFSERMTFLFYADTLETVTASGVN